MRIIFTFVATMWCWCSWPYKSQSQFHKKKSLLFSITYRTIFAIINITLKSGELTLGAKFFEFAKGCLSLLSYFVVLKVAPNMSLVKLENSRFSKVIEWPPSNFQGSFELHICQLILSLVVMNKWVDLHAKKQTSNSIH